MMRFTPGPLVGGCERIECLVIDALDEVHIDPVPPDDSQCGGLDLPQVSERRY